MLLQNTLPAWVESAVGNFVDYQHTETEKNVRHFADDTFKCIFLDENVRIPIRIPLKCVPEGPIW